MFKFIRESFQELAHVVWPTKKESRTYMWYTVSIIVSMTIFLSSVGYAAHFVLKETRQAINPNANIPIQNPNDIATKKDLQDIYKQFGLSGSTIGVNESTGAVSTSTGAVLKKSHTETQKSNKSANSKEINISANNKNIPTNNTEHKDKSPEKIQNSNINPGTTSSKS